MRRKELLGSAFRCQSSLKVLGVNTRLGPLRPSHLWSLRSVHFNEVGLGRASSQSIQPSTFGNARASRTAAGN